MTIRPTANQITQLEQLLGTNLLLYVGRADDPRIITSWRRAQFNPQEGDRLAQVLAIGNRLGAANRTHLLAGFLRAPGPGGQPSPAEIIRNRTELWSSLLERTDAFLRPYL